MAGNNYGLSALIAWQKNSDRPSSLLRHYGAATLQTSARVHCQPQTQRSSSSMPLGVHGRLPVSDLTGDEEVGLIKFIKSIWKAFCGHDPKHALIKSSSDPLCGFLQEESSALNSTSVLTAVYTSGTHFSCKQLEGEGRIWFIPGRSKSLQIFPLKDVSVSNKRRQSPLPSYSKAQQSHICPVTAIQKKNPQSYLLFR